MVSLISGNSKPSSDRPDPSGKIPKGVLNVPMIFQAASLAGRVVESRLGRRRPLLGGVKLTHDCNLSCVHCPFWKRESASLTFRQAVDALGTLRGMGVRFVIFEGGEPFVWRDGDHALADVVREARNRFACVGVTTNGTHPIEVDSDIVCNKGTQCSIAARASTPTGSALWPRLRSCGLGYLFLELAAR